MSENVRYLPIPWPVPEEEPAAIEDAVEVPIERQIAELEAELAANPAVSAAEIARADRFIDEGEAVVLLILASAEVMIREAAL